MPLDLQAGPAPSPLKVLQVLCGIIQEQLKLADDQVMVYNQRWKIPPDDRLYVTVKFAGSKPYSVRRLYASITGGLQQSQSVNSRAMITLNVMSSSSEAVSLKDQVLLALSSDLAERAMDRYGFSVGPVPTSFVDLSGEEGAAILYRYAITFMVLTAADATSAVPYFDKFPRNVIVQP